MSNENEWGSDVKKQYTNNTFFSLTGFLSLPPLRRSKLLTDLDAGVYDCKSALVNVWMKLLVLEVTVEIGTALLLTKTVQDAKIKTESIDTMSNK